MSAAPHARVCSPRGRFARRDTPSATSPRFRRTGAPVRPTILHLRSPPLKRPRAAPPAKPPQLPRHGPRCRPVRHSEDSERPGRMPPRSPQARRRPPPRPGMPLPSRATSPNNLAQQPPSPSQWRPRPPNQSLGQHRRHTRPRQRQHQARRRNRPVHPSRPQQPARARGRPSLRRPTRAHRGPPPRRPWQRRESPRPRPSNGPARASPRQPRGGRAHRRLLLLRQQYRRPTRARQPASSWPRMVPASQGTPL